VKEKVERILREAIEEERSVGGGKGEIYSQI